MRGMLEQWIRKGKVARRMAGKACGAGCSKCDPAAVEIYLWVDAANPANRVSEPSAQGRACPD